MWKEVLNFSLKNGGTLTATQANIWQGSLTIEQSVSADDTFELGSTHIGQMTVTLADLQVSQIQDATFSLNTEGHLILDGERVPYQTVYANVDFTDAVVVVYMAQDDDTLTQMGVYNVVQTTRDDGIISITAYDNMDKLSEVYTTSLTFPSTYGAMANEITGQLLTFDGSSTAVAEKPEAEDLTKREVLGYIAQACGYNVLCNPQGYFQFVRYNLSGFSTQGQYHEISGLYSFHHSQYPVVITGVKVIVTDEEMTTDPDTGDTVAEIVTHEYTAGTDAYQLVIEENPLITTTNGQAVADALYALYGNVEFYTGDVSHLSDLSIKASDIMKVTDRHNNTFPMLVSRTVISTGSAQSTSSYAEEPSRKIVTQPSQMSRIQNSVKQVAVDAKNGKRIASNTNQYFWHTETGSDTGAHITEIPREDFLDDPTSGGGNTLIRSNGVAIRDGLTELSTFGAFGAQLGKEDTAHILLTNAGMTGVSSDSTETFRISVGDYTGTAKISESSGIIENANTNKSILPQFTYTPNADPVDLTNILIDVTVVATSSGHTRSLTLRTTRIYDESQIATDGLVQSAQPFVTYGDYTRIEVTVRWFTNAKDSFVSAQVTTAGSTATIDNVQVFCTLTTANPVAPSYTFGLRSGTRSEEGAYSFVGGTQNIASGEASSVFGAENVVGGMGSASFGAQNTVTGNYGLASGQGNVVTGDKATALGDHLLAYTSHQTVLGHYNVGDENDEYALIVGNGDVSDRSNAFAVGWDGSVVAWGVKSFTPTWGTNQTPVRYHCVVSAGICSFFFMGNGVAHSQGDLICTLPEGARPKAQVNVPFVKMTGNVVGVLTITSVGAVTVGFISSTTSTGRIYLNCTYPVV